MWADSAALWYAHGVRERATNVYALIGGSLVAGALALAHARARRERNRSRVRRRRRARLGLGYTGVLRGIDALGGAHAAIACVALLGIATFVITRALSSEKNRPWQILGASSLR